MTLTIRDCSNDDLVAIDPYRANTRGRMAVALEVSPADGVVKLITYSPGQAISADRWHRRIVFISVESEHGSGEIDGEKLIARLRDPASPARQLLDRVVAGHSIAWDGQNKAGALTEDGEDALYRLEQLLAKVPGTGHVLWQAGDFYEGEGWRQTARRLGITDATPDDRLEALVETEIPSAREDRVLLEHDDVFRHLRWIRDQLIAEVKRESEEAVD